MNLSLILKNPLIAPESSGSQEEKRCEKGMLVEVGVIALLTSLLVAGIAYSSVKKRKEEIKLEPILL